MTTDAPGAVLFYYGAAPTFIRSLNGDEWHCRHCKVTVPAGVIPFPHQGCAPGTVVEVWPPALAMGREFDAIEFDWPVAA